MLRTAPVAIIIGGSHGIGRAVAGALAGRGYAVVVGYLCDQDKAEAAVEQIAAANGTALTVRADITDELDVERLFDETKAAFGSVDIVVLTSPRGSTVVNQEAARQLRRGGSIVNASCSKAIAPAVAEELRARDITVNALAPALEPPGADHGIPDLLALLELRYGRGGSDTEHPE
jgi:3-oxoacyl-[acyl-carrier protein] reductase